MTPRPVRILALALATLTLGACAQSSAPQRPRTVTPDVASSTPAVLRGTIVNNARFNGVLPSRISGIGFVVGLNGTGGLQLNEEIIATLERMMLLRGVGQTGTYSGTAIAGRSPRELIQDPNTAAVIVEAAVPPGALAGDSFDVYVRALNATSLEGGRLWTCDLQVGAPTLLGQAQARSIAQAAGPIFINPFSEPDQPNVGVSQTIGRILGGGIMTDDLRIEVILNRASHSQARLVTSSINSTFPKGPLDEDQIARGRDDRLVVVRVPRRFADRRDDFVQLLQYTVIDQTYPELYARRFSQAMRDNPANADRYAWALEAIGNRALPFIRDLYDIQEPAPRLRALRTGAHLGDPMAADPLIDLARSGPADLRSGAIRLLEYIDAGPKVEFALGNLLEDDLISVRIAAYETLTERGIKRRRDQLQRYDNSRPGGERARLSLSAIETLSRLSVPDGTIFAVNRRLAGGKFFLDRIPAGKGLIYITQQGEPRLAVFGAGEGFAPTFSAVIWSERFIIVRDELNGPIRLSYRRSTDGPAVIIDDVPDSIGLFIQMLAHKPTPENPQPGLDMTYSEIIGVLYQLNQLGIIDTAFTTEFDRLQAELRAAAGTEEVQLRPETPEDQEPVIIRGYDDPTQELTPQRDDGPDSLLVPLGPPKSQGTDAADPPDPSP